MLPIIRWTGSKRYQAIAIVDNFPKEINTYYETFLGGGSVLGEYLLRLDNGHYKVNQIICTDINKDLIDVWNFIKQDPNKFVKEYSKFYEQFSPLDYDKRKEFYNKVRDKFNKLKREGDNSQERTILFYWLMRTCFNGLVRYDKNGNFNTSCHFTRHGMTPEKVSNIINEWSRLINKFNVQFKNISYKELTNITSKDIVYCDPPYANSGGMYDFGDFDNITFFDWLRQLPCKYLLSYDGKSGDINNTYEMPQDIYTSHIYINSSQSGFKKLVKNETAEVYDSLYIKEKENS